MLRSTLSPGEKVRGDVAFDVNNSTGNKMIIYSVLEGFLNTGTYKPERIPSSLTPENSANESNMSKGILKDVEGKDNLSNSRILSNISEQIQRGIEKCTKYHIDC